MLEKCSPFNVAVMQLMLLCSLLHFVAFLASNEFMKHDYCFVFLYINYSYAF